ncbi:hypothetical protein [Pseudomonas sp. NFX15]|uniref:hypothetical protein n=1 Tax=Pseudomonas sp. NFX15 TaxID=2816958 RepID=UPI003B8B0352
MALNLKDNGRTITLDYDPWSNINVIKENSIDQKDSDAITELAVAYDRQSTIGPEHGAFLRFRARPAASRFFDSPLTGL